MPFASAQKPFRVRPKCLSRLRKMKETEFLQFFLGLATALLFIEQLEVLSLQDEV